MSAKRVIAHFMHENELAEAINLTSNRNITESYVIGDIEEENITKLQDQGLIVQVLEETAQPPSAGAAAEELDDFGAPAAPSSRAPSVRQPQTASRAPGSQKAQFFNISLAGPLLEEWRAALSQEGVRLLECMEKRTYSAKLRPQQVQEVRELPFVVSVELIEPGVKLQVEASRSVPAPAPPAMGGFGSILPRLMKVYDVRLHLDEDLQEVIGALQELGVTIAGASGRKIRVYMLEDEALLDDIRFISEIADVQEYIPPKLHNDVARQLMGIDVKEARATRSVITETGEGQIVGVADTGLDVDHPDFQGRIAGVVALGRPNDPTDPNGHGTHVAGSVLGDGSASRGKIRGAAPQAKLFFQSLLDAQGGLGGLPLNLADLFEEAYNAGARIHNNSWGAATESMYTFNSSEVDEFIASHRDMLVVISAGNDGNAAIFRNAQKGFVDWLSIGSPASSKNGLTVGASRTNRTTGGISNLTYRSAWPSDFPDAPIGDEKISGNPDCLAAFSSRGPCDDHRIKPDIVAPGTDIISTKSSRAPLRNYWGPYPRNGHYAYMGGTSMSAPLVSGCAALVREYFVKSRNHAPSAALLKAALINGTRELCGPDAIADHAFLPNYHQGFGGLYMPWTIPNPSMPGMRLEFVDNWQDPTTQFVRTGQRFRFRFSISGGAWLRITMAYTDLPARGLQNNLNLFMQYQGTGEKWFGNPQLPLGLKIPDPDNNVEVIRLENPPAGDYLIQVSAVNLLQNWQDFALVVSGELSSDLVRI